MQTLRLPLGRRHGTVQTMRGEAFFRRLDDDVFEATKWTRGPWSPKHQHAGPPSALCAGQLEAMCSDAFRVVRVAVEILRPVPIGTLRLERSVRRDGTVVKVLTGGLFDEEGKLVLGADEAPPDTGRPERFPFFDAGSNYAGAMEGRFTRGTFGDGDVMAWLRTRIALIEAEPPSPLERVMIAADSGNGVSQRLPTRDFTFVNPDLTVTLHRPLEGEWVGLRARTDFDDRGVGMADTRLYDEHGPIGRGVQTLVVRKRSL